jgi:hypothetical protein
MVTKLTSSAKLLFSFLFIVALTLGLSISFQSLLAAWTAPTANPPTCAPGNPGCDAPINTGSATQFKAGSFEADGLLRGYSSVIFDGNVLVGAAAKLQINPPTGVEGLRIITASNYSPLNIRNNANNADIFRVDQNGDIKAGRTIYKDASGNVIIQLGN